MTRVVFEIAGMTCNHCKMRVEKALKAVKGVSAVEVSLSRNNAVVTFDEAAASLPAMKAAIEDAGYEVAG